MGNAAPVSLRRRRPRSIPVAVVVVMGELAVRKVAAIGSGVIGGGWIARFLLNGIDTAVFDPAPIARQTVSEMLANAERAYAKLFPAPLPPRGMLTFASSIEEAVHGAGFIQESAPERLEVKQSILAEIDRQAPAGIPICSSTSGLRPSELQSGLAHPERMLVGHPFNPVYLLPLVEICGGLQTSGKVVERVCAFYRAIGMKPLVVRKEIDAFIADRLLEAQWREALWLVHDGIATVEEIDDAIRYGPGLRWAAMGTFQIYRIAGGEAGMRHFLSQFGPALKWPWTKLTEVPELSEALIERIAEQSDTQAGGRSIGELERKRDDCLVAILGGLKVQDWGAGATLGDYERRLADRLPELDAGTAGTAGS
jgi:3-hydroxyacyl-CoA dehydrogenase